MEDLLEGDPSEGPSEGVMVGLDSLRKDTIARKIGGRRRSSRVIRPKSMSPRLRLVDMKREGRRGRRGSSVPQIARRLSNWNKLSLNSSPKIDARGNSFCFEQDLEEEDGKVDDSPSVTEIMEVAGEEGRQGVGVAEQEVGLIGGFSGQALKDSSDIRGGPEVEDCLAAVAAEEVFGVLPMGDGRSEDMFLDGNLGRSGDGDSLGVVGLTQDNHSEEGEIRETSLVMAEMDNTLDLIEAQPLQNMEFMKAGESIGARRSLTELGSGCDGVRWAEIGEINLHDKAAVGRG